MINYLTPEQVLYLHNQLVMETGGSPDVRDMDMLLTALGCLQAAFDGKDLYPDLFMKAAALMDALVLNHQFVDGNKRTAIASAAIFLQINGYHLVVETEEMVDFTLACAHSRLSLDEIEAWFKRYSKPAED